MHVLADGEPVTCPEARGDLGDVRVVCVCLAFRLGRCFWSTLHEPPRCRAAWQLLLADSRPERRRTPARPPHTKPESAGRRRTSAPSAVGRSGAKSAHCGAGTGFASGPRSRGGTAAEIFSESKRIRGSRPREDRRRLSSSVTRCSTASVLATASSSRAAASAARRSFSACFFLCSRSRCAARSEAAHCRYEPPEEPDPRVIAHLLTFSNDFHIESNFCGP